MIPRERVLASCPTAECEQCDCCGWWFVWTDDDATWLGAGNTEDAAWAHALSVLGESPL